MGLSRLVSIAALIGAISASVSPQAIAAPSSPIRTPSASRVPPPQAVAPDVPGPIGRGRAAAILYDQYNNAGGVAVSSDDFKPSQWDSFDDTAADDFVVPAGKHWSVTELKLSGGYTPTGGGSTGPADWVNVTIYQDAGGLPGAAVYAASNLAPSGGLASGSFILDLTSAAVLSAGKYWLGVQASILYVDHGTWRWTDRTVTSNSAAVWRNPGGGFGISACANWGARGSKCGLDPTEPDQVFSILGTQCPAITGFSPAQGPVGTQVIISGSGFTGATAVKFNGTSATFTVNSDTQITATVPTGATTGPITVTGPGCTGTSTTNFTVTALITGFSPPKGPVGTQVIISGSGFTGATAVRFNGKSATFTVNSDTQITATVPTGATTGPITVTGPGGRGTSTTNFTVTVALKRVVTTAGLRLAAVRA